MQREQPKEILLQRGQGLVVIKTKQKKPRYGNNFFFFFFHLSLGWEKVGYTPQFERTAQKQDRSLVLTVDTASGVHELLNVAEAAVQVYLEYLN